VLERMEITPKPHDGRRLAVDLTLVIPIDRRPNGAQTPRGAAAPPVPDQQLRLHSTDPFWEQRPLHGRRIRPAGTIGLLIDDLRLLGCRSFGVGYVARVQDSRREIYLLRKGDRLYDGEVVEVFPRELVFRQIVEDPSALKPFREVVKRPRPPFDPISLGDSGR